jgi:two-component system NtrC family response regulator
MPLALQSKLLRFLQDRIVERIGGRDGIAVDVRIVCATNKDPTVLIQGGEFREDLYYRISEVTVRIPPLRDRGGDAIVIARAILDRRAAEHGRPVRGFTPEALKAIEAYPWPGNIRELENRVNGAVIMTEGKYVSEVDLGLPCDRGSDLTWLNLRLARQRAEREAIRQALAVSGWNLSRAAELLGITRPTLYDLLEKNDIAVPERTAGG